jgi:hypothetical protein
MVNLLKLAMLVGMGVVLTHAPAYAIVSDTMLLCINDFKTSTSCVTGTGGGSDFIELEAAGSSVTVVDSGGTVNPAGDFSLAGAGIGYEGSIGSSSFNVEIAEFDHSGSPSMQLSYNDITNAASYLNIYWAVSGFTGTAPFSATMSGSNQGGSSSTLTACLENSSAADPGTFSNCGGTKILNGSAGTGPSTGSIGSQTFSGSSFTGTFTSTAVNSTTPFGLLQEVDIHEPSSGFNEVSDGFDLVPAPEPTSILMVGGALLLACSALLRKLRKS